MRICPYTSTSCPYTPPGMPPPPLNPPRRKAKKAKVATIIVGVILVIAILFFALFFGIDSIFKNHLSYQVATDYIIANSEIVAVIGEVEGFGFLPIRNFYFSPSRGYADYVIIAKGAHGDVRVFIELQRHGDGDWEIVRFSFEPR